MTLQALLGKRGQEFYYVAILTKGDLNIISNVKLSNTKNILKVPIETIGKWIEVELELEEKLILGVGF